MKSFAFGLGQLSLSIVLAITNGLPASGATLLSEDFNNVPGLTGANWVIVNNSAPIGSTSWFQGESGTFGSHLGAADAYAAANFNAADFGGNVSVYLITPVINHTGDVSVSFYTRTTTGGSGYLDTLQLLLNNSATTATNDFSLSLYTTPSSYFEDWTQVTVNASLVGPSRLAFLYSVNNTELNGNYIGIDTFAVSDVSDVPEPGTYVISSLGLLALAAMRRRS